MASSFPHLFAGSGRIVWQVPSLRRILSRIRRRARLVVLDPDHLTDAQKRDIGLLDGRGPLNRRPERDPTALT